MGALLHEVLPEVPEIRITDVGASAIDGPPPWERLRNAGRVDLVGFEPDHAQFARLQADGRPRSTFLPHAVGDGTAGELRICRAPGMTSMLEPDPELLSHFHGFGQWGEVVRREPMDTVRLDDCPEAAGTDFLKLDIQGGELAALAGATALLEGAICIHTEVQFVPFYKDQPLFAEIDQTLRAAGFAFHRFAAVHSRVLKPLTVDNDIYAGLSQELWGDAVYFKRFTDFGALSSDALLKTAVVAHDIYQSADLAALALRHVDRRDGRKREARYLAALMDTAAIA